jgi:hypothetical protein
MLSLIIDNSIEDSSPPDPKAGSGLQTSVNLRGPLRPNHDMLLLWQKKRRGRLH